MRAFPLDVLDLAAVRRTVAEIEQVFGGIDLAILNAGSHVPGENRIFDGQQFADNMALNYLGMVYGIDAVLPGMLSRGRGHIAGVASAAGFRAVPAAAAYGASKAAVIHMLDSIRFELEPRGIAVTVVNPGFVKTPLTDRNRYPMPFLMPVDRAAEALIRGLEAGRREVHFPRIFTLTLKFLRILAVSDLSLDHLARDQRTAPRQGRDARIAAGTCRLPWTSFRQPDAGGGRIPPLSEHLRAVSS